MQGEWCSWSLSHNGQYTTCRTVSRRNTVIGAMSVGPHYVNRRTRGCGCCDDPMELVATHLPPEAMTPLSHSRISSRCQKRI